ncbi:MAG: homocysteine biosynthesis protein [Pseudomonadota bacterium]
MHLPKQKTYDEINQKIKAGKAVVVTAEEIIDIVREHGHKEAARKVDVVTTGTFSPMCSSGVFINFGHTTPGTKASKVWFNGVSAYAGLAAVDCYLGATEPAESDPLNKVYPGEFRYGGGHVIHDLVAGKNVRLKVGAYGTDCYPNLGFEKEVALQNLPQATLCNPRNAYQNYNCAVNLSGRIIYTYMGTLRPQAGNINYAGAGQLSPLINDPHYLTTGIGTRIFLGGGVGYVVWNGTQHNPNARRNPQGIPIGPGGTLWLMGDLKNMQPEWLVGVSLQGYGCSIAVGIGVPIPILNEDILRYTAISDEEISTNIIDFGNPENPNRICGTVSYAQLKSGIVQLNGKDVPTAPLSSVLKARQISELLKTWIQSGNFLLTEPQQLLPNG